MSDSILTPPKLPALEELMRRHDTRAFDDLLTIAVCCFAMQTMEKRYLETIKPYDKKDLDLFAQALGEVIAVYDKHITPEGGWYDGLGRYFESINGKFGRDARGQFFTPEHLCTLMAELTMKDQPVPRTISDCAVGSGRNLLAASRISPEYNGVLFHGQDIDERCVKMCLINMVLHGLKGYVVWGNTLSMEIWRTYKVNSPLIGGGCFEVPYAHFQEAMDYINAQAIEEPTSLIRLGEQAMLPLFLKD